MTKDKRELTSALTHLGGAIFGFIGLFLLMNAAGESSNPKTQPAFFIYGLSLILLYSTSSIYHFIDAEKTRAKLMMRKLDHIMIFILIAGTYTPVCLLVLDESIGYKLLALVWSIAIIGGFIKIFWIGAPRWVSTSLYIIMGWSAILVLKPLFETMEPWGIFWTVLGGLFYTVGGLIYGLKKPKIDKPWFGFHELFHVFVLAGSLCHFIMVYFYIR